MWGVFRWRSYCPCIIKNDNYLLELSTIYTYNSTRHKIMIYCYEKRPRPRILHFLLPRRSSLTSIMYLTNQTPWTNPRDTFRCQTQPTQTTSIYSRRHRDNRNWYQTRRNPRQRSVQRMSRLPVPSYTWPKLCKPFFSCSRVVPSICL